MNFSPINGLELFGSPSITGPDGAHVAGRAAQRHRLALLALLALSPGMRSSRDRVMAYLWPESDLDHARNLLKVSVYVLRKALGEDAVLSEGDELRLNPDVIGTDVALFEAAIQEADYEKAVALCDGPLLDGFSLAGALEFERWVDGERARLAAARDRALEALAEQAESGLDFRGAVSWWKARAAHDPYDSKVALRLMQALATDGNPAGALQYAAIHERLLRDELGIEPAREIAAFADRLRSEPVVRRSAPSFRLQTLGTLSLSGPRPAAPARAGTDERRLLPLLAVLATAGAGGFDRDRLLLFFWPDASPQRARDALDALLNTIRASLHESVLLGGDTLRLDPSIITSDVADFEHALQAGRLDEAIEQYRGPFLDGFQLGNAPEFEQWVRAERGRLAAEHDAARARLASTSAPPADVTTVAPTRQRTRRALPYAAGIAALLLVVYGAIRITNGVRPAPVGPQQVARPACQNPVAQDYYRQSQDPGHARSDSGTRLKLQYLRLAVEADSTCAAALALLASAHVMNATTDESIPARDRLALAETLARRALALDSSLADAHAALGRVSYASYDFAEAEKEYDHAIRLDPAGRGQVNRAQLIYLYIWQGRNRDALEEALRALREEPASPAAHAEVAHALAVNGRCRDALVQLEAIADVQPPLLRPGPIAAQCHALNGEWRKAIEAMRHARRSRAPLGIGMVGYLFGRAGERDSAIAIRDTLLARYQRTRSNAFSVALVYAGLGDDVLAFDWLEKSIADRSLGYIIMEPLFEDLRRDPRFTRLRERLSLPPP
jgi:DNA-binding SARP family transcriptional activator